MPYAISGHAPPVSRYLATALPSRRQLLHLRFPRTFALAFCLVLAGCGEPPALESTDASEARMPEFSDDIKSILERRIELVREFLKNETIVAAVEASNIRRVNMTHDKVMELDAVWRQSADISPFINEHMTNPCAKELMQFQETDLGISEFFITDSRGMNVCQTNKTTDFYQADEQWWIDCFADGSGNAYFGQIEYDESAQSEAISIYVPVVDQQATHAIGVVKVVVDITSIKQEL